MMAQGCDGRHVGIALIAGNSRRTQLLKGMIVGRLRARHGWCPVASFVSRRFTMNVGMPQRVIDGWLEHRSGESMETVYYRLRDEDSQSFMIKLSFGMFKSAADAGKEEM